LLDGTVRKTTREGLLLKRTKIQKPDAMFPSIVRNFGESNYRTSLRSYCSYAGLESFMVLLGPVDSNLSSTLNNVSFKTAQPSFEGSLIAFAMSNHAAVPVSRIFGEN
jgi:hypothetical protein